MRIAGRWGTPASVAGRADAELVALGVGEDDPAFAPLLDGTFEPRGAEAERLVALGATRMEGPIEEWGERWIVLADPEGNELCVCSARH